MPLPQSDSPGLKAPRLLTTAQAADRLGVHRDTIYHLIDEGKLQAVRFGENNSPYRIRPESLERLVGGEIY